MSTRLMAPMTGTFLLSKFEGSNPTCVLLTIVRLDLTMTFNDGFRLDFGTPSWNTYEGSYNNFYPQIEQICPEDADPDAERTYSAINNLPPSILSQSTTVQRKKSWNGSIETRVILKNKFTDGKEEEKTITNDSSKVLEEVSKLDASVKRRHDAVGLALWELSYHKQKEFLASAMEMEDDGVD